MTLEQKQAVLDKFGKEMVNNIFRSFLNGASIDKIGKTLVRATRAEIEDVLRANFYCLDAIIIDQKEEIEGLELAFNSVCHLLPDEIKEKLKKKK